MDEEQLTKLRACLAGCRLELATTPPPATAASGVVPVRIVPVWIVAVRPAMEIGEPRYGVRPPVCRAELQNMKVLWL